MKKTLVLLLFSVFCLFGLAQNLDRISLSSGGVSTDEVNYVIGETFNFTMAQSDIVLETGSLGSEENTGGDIIYTLVKELAEVSPMYCYPNPVSDILNLQTGLTNNKLINLRVYNALGQVVFQEQVQNQFEISLDFSRFDSGIYHLAIIDSKNQEIKATKIIKY
ncbi:MAG: T9SS type A sorting domain-containing protein [Bacteroidales bacterium]|jgi:hypothetical protein|nr:T9SS type A sorting domain-containing protein [Bacteroidales bacterium]MCK9499551.1 T9SS type A sorting domain-containing protein [Bacteroidales bacterium]MDY0315549.1 T9SS type A sorting domain-containing protein [Bacteroidales bacterium]